MFNLGSMQRHIHFGFCWHSVTVVGEITLVQQNRSTAGPEIMVKAMVTCTHCDPCANDSNHLRYKNNPREQMCERQKHNRNINQMRHTHILYTYIYIYIQNQIQIEYIPCLHVLCTWHDVVVCIYINIFTYTHIFT